jgi:hypothetical protein
MTHIIRGFNYGNRAAGNYATFGDDGTLQVYGEATAHEDLRVEGMTTRVGTVAPTDGTGFRGDANHQQRTFVHTQADEVQFLIQMPHAWVGGSTGIEPHVHFCPTTSTAGTASYAVRFALEYYWANVGAQFPATPGTILMTETWTGEAQWKHLIADAGSALTLTDGALSAILKCRLFRDNTVANNYAAPVTLLYFDAHYEVDSLGSSQEYIK